MTYDYEIDLISTTYQVDEIGDSVETETKRTVFAAVLTYRNKDYYEALSSGLKPSINFAINRHEYDGEETIEHEGKRYRILDVFPVNVRDESEFEAVSLLCEGVV